MRLGFVTSFARPAGNLTGISFLTAELVAKGLGLLHDLVPQAARVAVLVNPANVAYVEFTLRDADAAARAKGLQITFSAQAPAARSIRRLKRLCASGLTPSSSLTMPSFTADVSKLSNWRLTIVFLRLIQSSNFPKSAA